MSIAKKSTNKIVPQYSLTGDLLSFMRCGLQYRYHSGSALPPSRPVQLWFGEFIHGVMEAAYRIWRDMEPSPAFPWPSNPTPYRGQPREDRVLHDIGEIGDVVEGLLRAQGKNPRSEKTRNSAYKRATYAVNYFGEHLFPLIASAEEKVIGTRAIPQLPNEASSARRADLYELHGIIDVLTNMQLSGVDDNNIIRRAIGEVMPGLTGTYEVIVDYKGSRRPRTTHLYWSQGDWQIQTYAWLRGKQADSLPVVAGVLLYINELAPTSDDIASLKKEMADNSTDVLPENGSKDYYTINAWRQGDAIPELSLEYRLRRAIRVIPVTEESKKISTDEFDKTVQTIEHCVNQEAMSGVILENWSACGEEATCVACDFKSFCPSPAPRKPGEYIVTAPRAP